MGEEGGGGGGGGGGEWGVGQIHFSFQVGPIESVILFSPEKKRVFETDLQLAHPF